jgi:nicotinic acid mononucleotide adenylyltransferase
MLVALLKNPDVAVVHLVPTFQNPLKKASGGLVPTPALKKRFVEAWIASLKNRGVEGLAKLRVEWLEVESAEPSYTVETLARLQEREGSTDAWTLCLGDDCLPDFDRWKEVDRLLKLVKEVWIFRRGAGGGNFLAPLPERLRVSSSWRLMVPEIKDVSSTEIRAVLEIPEADARQDRLKGLVLPELLAVL